MLSLRRHLILHARFLFSSRAHTHTRENKNKRDAREKKRKEKSGVLLQLQLVNAGWALGNAPGYISSALLTLQKLACSRRWSITMATSTHNRLGVRFRANLLSCNRTEKKIKIKNKKIRSLFSRTWNRRQCVFTVVELMIVIQYYTLLYSYRTFLILARCSQSTVWILKL